MLLRSPPPAEPVFVKHVVDVVVNSFVVCRPVKCFAVAVREVVSVSPPFPDTVLCLAWRDFFWDLFGTLLGPPLDPRKTSLAFLLNLYNIISG